LEIVKKFPQDFYFSKKLPQDFVFTKKAPRTRGVLGGLRGGVYAKVFQLSISIWIESDTDRVLQGNQSCMELFSVWDCKI
jgi:hypothetical protein